jgi:DNA invertase Pin-like site-specific DNA recombinase
MDGVGSIAGASVNGWIPGSSRMLEDAARHSFDILLFWSLDRFCREGSYRTLHYLSQLSASGVKFRSYMEPYIDTSAPMGEAIVAILAAMAKQESVRRSERVKAGMTRAKSQGKQIGGRRRKFSTEEFARLAQAGFTTAELMAHFGIKRGLVFKVKREIREQGAVQV